MDPTRPTTHPWQRFLARLLSRAWVEVGIGVLILLSVVLTITEFALSASSSALSITSMRVLSGIQATNLALTMIFVVELLMRLAAIGSLRRFSQEYWIDILAVLPSLLPNWGPARLMRIVRLMRILRLFGYVRRFSSNFPYILRRGVVEYITVTGLLGLTVMLGTGALIIFEKNQTLNDAFWFSLYSMFAGEPVGEEPRTIGGHIVTVCVMFMGLTVFAMFTGTVSAFMVERIRTKERKVNWDELHDHIVICGWNSKAEIILREFRAAGKTKETPIVVIAEWEHEPPTLPHGLQSRVHFLCDDFTRVPVLEQVGIHRAQTCILLADLTDGRSEQDADARTILAALTVEKLNPSVYTCAEIHSSDYGSHLEMGRVNDYVVTGEQGAYMMAQAVMNRGLMGVFSELLTYERGNQFYRIPVPASWVSRNFDDVFSEIKRSHDAILVAVHGRGGLDINPVGYQFSSGDEVIVIADRPVRF